MSNLVYQNYNNKCNGWTNPSVVFSGPNIAFLSGYQSPAGSYTVVSVNGYNFYSYSIVRFGTFFPTVYFINSNILQFYVPATLSSGTFPVQVFNGSNPSNSVNYTIDNASGYWLLNGNESISNTNSGIISISALSRGPPLTIKLPIYNFNDFTTNPNSIKLNWVICDTNTVGGIITITLPTSPADGLEIMLKNIGPHNVKSASPNISTDGTAINDIILAVGSGNWVTLVYNIIGGGGIPIWIIMQQG